MTIRSGTDALEFVVGHFVFAHLSCDGNRRGGGMITKADELISLEMSLFGDHLYQFGKERYINIGDAYSGYVVLDVKEKFKVHITNLKKFLKIKTAIEV